MGRKKKYILETNKTITAKLTDDEDIKLKETLDKNYVGTRPDFFRELILYYLENPNILKKKNITSIKTLSSGLNLLDEEKTVKIK